MNPSIFQAVWELFINALEVILFNIFVISKLDNQRKTTISYILQFVFLTVWVFITYICNHSTLSTLATIIFSLLISVMYAVLFFKDTMIHCIFWASIYSAICIVSEYITMLIPQVFTSFSIEEILAGGNLRVPFSLLYIALISVFVFLFTHIFNSKIYLTLIQKIVYILLSTLGIGISHYILIITLGFSGHEGTSHITDSLVLINLFFLTMFFALLIYIYQLGHSEEKNNRFIEQAKQHELEEQQYHILLETTQALREMKHDVTIHLDVIQALLQQKEIDKLQEYIQAYHTSLEHTHRLVSTGNTAIDCILSTKLSRAKQEEITIEYSVMAPAPFPVDNIALSSLLGNMLDNAIEGCLRFRNSQPNEPMWIRFYIKPFQNMILIHSDNSFDGQLKEKPDHSFLSSKCGSNHGIGMKRIRDIVSEYGGIVQFTQENNIFSVHVMIPTREDIDET